MNVVETYSFGYWVHCRRIALGLTQAALAHQVGCATITIRKIESDERRPSRTMAERLAESLGIPEFERETFILGGMGEVPVYVMPPSSEPVYQDPARKVLINQPIKEFSETAKQVAPILAATSVPTHNLPSQLTPFIGRQDELARLDDMLWDQNIRLVTILAPGGMGKTRLAIACGEQQLAQSIPEFVDGVFSVPFSQVLEVDQIVFSIAGAINLKIEAKSTVDQSPKAQLLNHLRPQQMLLLADSFEHLINHADLLVEILRIAPRVKILVTSRERLNIQAEQVFPIGGLPSSDPEEAPEKVAESPAAQLFTQSARRLLPDFLIMSEKEVEALSLICHLVGGMPLALELAAGWVDTLSLAEIAVEIQRSLDFLETDLQDIPPRHRGIRIVFDSTWERLDEEERDGFLRFSIFKGGCTRQAAQAVTCASLQTLASLSKKYLVQYRDTDGRYTVHELMHQYAAEKLAADTEIETAVRDDHCAYYCTALEKWEAELKSARQSKAVAEIQADYRNIQAAWTWAMAYGNLYNLTIASDGLGEYFVARGHWTEGVAFFQKAAKRLQALYGMPPTTTGAARLLARLLTWQESNHWDPVPHKDIKGRERILFQSLSLLSCPDLIEQDTRAEEAFIHLQLGYCFGLTDRTEFHDEGREHLEESLRLYRSLGNDVGEADALYVLHYFEIAEGKLKRAQSLLGDSLTIQHRIGDPRRITRSLVAQGEISRHELQAYDEAREIFNRAYDAAQTGRYFIGMLNARRYAGFLAWFLGEFDSALRYFEDGLALSHERGSQRQSAWFQKLIGLTHAYRGQFSLAARLLDEKITDYQYKEERYDILLVVALIHAGRYEEGKTLVKKVIKEAGYWAKAWSYRILSWLATAAEVYSEALEYSQRSVALCRIKLFRNMSQEEIAWSQAALGRALFGLGQVDKAKDELYKALEICVKIQAFLPLMHLMPILPVVLAGSGDQVLQERAIELYAMAKTLPFVANSRLFEEIAQVPLQEATAHLLQEVIQAAQSRGQELDWWETAAMLLDELRELGWAGYSDQACHDD